MNRKREKTKLRLARESLRRLDAGDLRDVKGGVRYSQRTRCDTDVEPFTAVCQTK